MKSIHTHDFAILIISDEYIKSKNCMYEVLQIIDNPNFRNIIFPVVIENKIYQIKERINYLEYWDKLYKELTSIINEKDLQNYECTVNDLKIIKTICEKVYNFLLVVADMNNPSSVSTVEAIKDVLVNKKIID